MANKNESQLLKKILQITNMNKDFSNEVKEFIEIFKKSNTGKAKK